MTETTTPKFSITHSASERFGTYLPIFTEEILAIAPEAVRFLEISTRGHHRSTVVFKETRWNRHAPARWKKLFEFKPTKLTPAVKKWVKEFVDGELAREAREAKLEADRVKLSASQSVAWKKLKPFVMETAEAHGLTYYEHSDNFTNTYGSHNRTSVGKSGIKTPFGTLTTTKENLEATYTMLKALDAAAAPIKELLKKQQAS